MFMVTFQVWVLCERDNEIELQCYSDIWMISISMVRSVLCARARVRVRYLGRFMGLIWFWVELGTGCDVSVTVSLCLRYRNWWADTKVNVRSPEHGTVLGLGLCGR